MLNTKKKFNIPICEADAICLYKWVKFIQWTDLGSFLMLQELSLCLRSNFNIFRTFINFEHFLLANRFAFDHICIYRIRFLQAFSSLPFLHEIFWKIVSSFQTPQILPAEKFMYLANICKCLSTKHQNSNVGFNIRFHCSIFVLDDFIHRTKEFALHCAYWKR